MQSRKHVSKSKVTNDTASSKAKTHVKRSDSVQNKKTNNESEEKEKIKRVTSEQTKTKAQMPQAVKMTAKQHQATSSRRPPQTPPSSRVTKTQYFPTRKVFTHALEELTKHDTSASVSALKTSDKSKVQKTTLKEEKQTPKASVIKVKKSKPIQPNKELERPLTATLKNPKVVKQEKTPSPEVVDYEDDFESYESDFDEYVSSDTSDILNLSGEVPSDESSSTPSLELPKSAGKQTNSAGTDDERKLDSGNFELPEQKHKQMLDNIKESIERENSALGHTMASLSDEGFEEVKSSLTENTQFINFSSAKKEYQRRKSTAKRLKRGQEILNMIRLDAQNFTILELAPVPYDQFIKLYGSKNGIQASVQTGDDDISEEVQTEMIEVTNKWTQMPAKFSKFDTTQPNYLDIYKCEYLGAGGDRVEKKENSELHFSENSCNKFILNTGQMMLELLRDRDLKLSKEFQNSEIPNFSNGYVEFNTKYLNKSCSIDYVSFCIDDSSKLLTVHYSLNCSSFICLWHISNPDLPEKVLMSHNRVSCCCMQRRLVFAGCNDGSVSVWNTKVKHNILKKNDDFDCQVPDFLTKIGDGHLCRIISLHLLPEYSELCSLDEEGCLIIWGVINTSDNTVLLVINKKILLQEVNPKLINLQCTDMIINGLSMNHLFVSTTHGCIMHALINNARPYPKTYISKTPSSINCLTTCPFSELHFLAGFENGNISLYNRLIEKPLMTLSNKTNNGCGIVQIQWSYTKPCVFYTRDRRNTIDIWNLEKSDLKPIESIKIRDPISFMSLVPIKEASNKVHKSYMVIGFSTGSLQMHLIVSEHGSFSRDEYQKDVKKFLNYVKRL